MLSGLTSWWRSTSWLLLFLYLSAWFVLGGCTARVYADSALETLIVTAPAQIEESALAANLIKIESASLLPGLRIDSAELLQRLPGVQADSRSNYAQDTRITLRGFGARSAFGVRGIDLRIDGIPLTTPDGQGQLSSVSLDGVTSVELLRGPIAALYGNGAGGVISLHSQAPTGNHLGVRFLGGADATQRQALYGEWQAENIALRLQSAHFSTDGHRPHASAERQQTAAQFYLTGSKGIEAVIRVDVSRDPLLEDPLALTPEQWRTDPLHVNSAAELFNTRKSIAHQQASLTLRQIQDGQSWQLQAWQGQREIVQYLGFSGADLTSAGGVVDLARDFYGLGGNYTTDLSWSLLPITVTLGMELAAMADARQGFVNERGSSGALRRKETGEVTSRDLYTILQSQLTDRWQWYAGVRSSRLDFRVDDDFITEDNPDDSGAKQFSEWSSAAGTRYHLADDWQIFASIGRGFETPTLTEMAYQTDHSGLNMALAASHNQQHELGLSFQPDAALTASLTLFSITSRNEILVDQSLGGRTTYRNAAATERQGLELTAEFALTTAWQAWVNLNYIDALYANRAGSQNYRQELRLPGVAQHNHALQLRWQPLLNEHLVLALAAHYRSQVATSDNNDVFAPAATTADLALSSRHDFGAWGFYTWLKLNNITDVHYVGSVIVNQANGRSFEPAAKRNLQAGLELTIDW